MVSRLPLPGAALLLPFRSAGPEKSLTKACVAIFFSESMAISLLRASILGGEPETEQESKPTITIEGNKDQEEHETGKINKQ